MSDDELVGEPVPGRPDLLKISKEPVPVVPNPHHSTRTKARKRALDLLFEAELRNRDLLTTLDEHVASNEPVVREFTAEIIRGIDEHLEAIDDRIDASCSDDWSLDRMPRVDRNLARIAVWEIDHSQAPAEAIIAECVSLAEEFSTDDSASFLNGLLAKVAADRPGDKA